MSVLKKLGIFEKIIITNLNQDIMRKAILILSLISLFLSSCDKKETGEPIIIGMWVCTHIDDKELPTDECFIMDFHENGTEDYAIGYETGEDSKKWVVNKDYKYSYVDNTLIVEGKDSFGVSTYLEAKVKTLSDNTLNYDLVKLTMDEELIPDTRNYSFKKIYYYLMPQLLGTWEGRNVTPGTDQTELHRWEYKTDGTFNYYYQNEKKEWVLKEDNNSKFFIYGDLMVSMWTNDYNTGSKGTFFECWWIKISGNQMNWETYKKDGSQVQFEMKKI